MSPLAFLLAIALAPLPADQPAPAATAIEAVVPARGAAPAVAGWRANEADNIAGLSDPKKLSSPAVVDYDALLEATAEMKKIKDERIDPDSTKGRSLRQQAADRVTKAAELIRKEKRHCSVWKKISHKDGRKVDDITSAVKAKLDSV